MGFFQKLFGTAAAVGTGAVAVKVAEKVKANNPDGIGDTNQDGKVDYKDYLLEVQAAAKELYSETAPKVKERAQAKIDEIKTAHPDAAEKIESVINQVKGTIGKF